MPQSSFCFGLKGSRRLSNTGATSSMYGLSHCRSKYSATRSLNTEGAKGLNDSRYLILRFITDCILEFPASPERSRPKFHPALKPPHDFSRSQLSRDIVKQRWVIEPVIRGPDCLQPGFHITIGVLRTQVAALHFVPGRLNRPWLVLILVPGAERGAHRSTCITSRRLDPHPLKWSFPKDPSISDAVEGHATR